MTKVFRRRFTYGVPSSHFNSNKYEMDKSMADCHTVELDCFKGHLNPLPNGFLTFNT